MGTDRRSFVSEILPDSKRSLKAPDQNVTDRPIIVSRAGSAAAAASSPYPHPRPPLSPLVLVVPQFGHDQQLLPAI